MKCRDVQAELSELASGELAPSQARRVRAHLEACASCQREHDELVATVRLLRGLAAEPLPDDFGGALHRGLVEAGRPDAPGFIARLEESFGDAWKPWLRLAGGLAFAASLALAVGLHVSGKAPWVHRPAAVDTVAAGPVAPTFRVPRARIAMIRIDFVADDSIEDVEFAIALPEGLHFVSEGKKLPDREFHWKGRLAQGSNSIPIAVRGDRAGRFVVAARAVGSAVEAHQQVVLEVTPG